MQRRVAKKITAISASMVILGVLALLLGSGIPTAAATSPANPECWGVATSDLATSSPQVVGDHASDPTDTGTPGSDTPREGLANFAIELGFDHISDLGSALDPNCP